MADLPESIMREARAVVRSFYRAPYGQEVLLVARALCARDERAARIARSFKNSTDYDLEPEAAVAENVTAEFIATAILSDEEGGSGNG